ncbi:MAG: type II methionyl aminopeptidase [Candidatus Nanoarchaeia archaeon]
METDFENYFKAGQIVVKIYNYAKKLIKENAFLLDTAEKIENKIIELNGKPAFPVNISINSIAAHYTPSFNDEKQFKIGDLVKVDFGVLVNSCCADFAFSCSIGKNEENEKLILAAEKALEAAIKMLKPSVCVSDIGAEIEKIANSFNCNPIKNLGGHGITEKNLHSAPTIPNFNNGDTTKLQEGVFAIEPFVTFGNGMVEDINACEIYSLVKLGAIKQKEVLSYVQENFGSFPFAKRWLIKKFGNLKTNLAVKEAVAKGLFKPHNVLKEVSNAKVAQFEHTLLIKNNEIKILTK